MGTLYVSEHNFYYSRLALLANGPLTPAARDRVVANQTQLKTWSESSPDNFQHKYDLVKAEWSRSQGNKSEAIDLYDRAIAGAHKNGRLQEEALANELAAKFFSGVGERKSRWGVYAISLRLLRSLGR